MIRYSTFLCLIILACSVFTLFKVKFYAQDLRKDIIEIQNQINKEKMANYVLKAEWTYLNNPTRLKKLVTKYTNLQPIKLDKIHKLENELPIYLSEDVDGRALYLASVELAKYAKKPNRNVSRENGIWRVKNSNPRSTNRTTKVKY
jgi:hypothetical protein